MTARPIDSIPLEGDLSWLEAYAEARASTRWETFCADCPARTSARSRPYCCQSPPKPPKPLARTFLQGLKAIAR